MSDLELFKFDPCLIAFPTSNLSDDLEPHWGTEEWKASIVSFIYIIYIEPNESIDCRQQLSQECMLRNPQFNQRQFMGVRYDQHLQKGPTYAAVSHPWRMGPRA